MLKSKTCAAGKGFSSLFKGKTIDKLEDCFHAFTEDEKLDGNEAFWCSVCSARTSAIKVLRIHRFPQALVLHIKRFKVLTPPVPSYSEESKTLIKTLLQLRWYSTKPLAGLYRLCKYVRLQCLGLSVLCQCQCMFL